MIHFLRNLVDYYSVQKQYSQIITPNLYGKKKIL